MLSEEKLYPETYCNLRSRVAYWPFNSKFGPEKQSFWLRKRIEKEGRREQLPNKNPASFYQTKKKKQGGGEGKIGIESSN